MTTSPEDADLSQLKKALQPILAGGERSQPGPQFRLEQRLAVHPRDIQRAILEVAPTIVHFAGAGTGDAGLLFSDAAGNAQPLSGAALGALFALFADHLQGVVLNGCYAPAQAQAIAQHIPWVIGIQQAIADQASLEFAISFYEALSTGRAVDFAYKLGCSAMQLAGVSNRLIPVLSNGSSGQAVSPPAANPAPAPAPNPAPVPGNTFNIAGSTISNLTGAGDIHHQTTQETRVQQSELADAQPPAGIAPIAWSTPSATAPPPSRDQPKSRQIELFFSYSHRDEALRDEMAKHLSILKRQGVINAWHDRDIEAGSEWAQAIDTHLNSAQVILLLISPDFIASDYCFDLEMRRALERHEAGEAYVVPVILRPVDWSGAPFSKLQALPIMRGGGAKPVTTWANRDEAFENIAKGIRTLVERLSKAEE